MLNVKVNELDIFDIVDLKNEFYIDIENDIDVNDIVLEICVGCRGEIDDIKKVNVVDGIFEVNDIDDISEIVLKDFDEDDLEEGDDIEECKESFLEFVCSEMYEVDNKKVWLEGWFEESNSYYVRLK